QLLFYSTATILHEKVSNFYIIDKEKKEPLEMVLYNPLTKTEKKVLQVLSDEGESLEEITNTYKKQHNEGTSSLLSRYLKKLAEDRLVETKGSIKSKTFYLSEKGIIVKNILSS
ncbi:MAG: hypothetical protein ACXACR_13905, partial [Candidatus Hodarchaeales archaeon]